MKFIGVMPALITPTKKDGTLNKQELERLIEALIAEGADGFYIGGATGEGIVLDMSACKTLITESLRIVNGRVPCIVHVARIVYAEMLELAQYAEEAGAAAVSAIPPMFYRYGDDGMVAYYRGLAESVKIPVVIYNNPNTGVAFGDALLDRLFEIPNVTAIKWTTYDYTAVMRLKSRHPEVNVINGPDEMLLMGLAAGCDAGIGTTYNFQFKTVKKLYDAYKAGDMELAVAQETKICNIVSIMAKYNIIMATKFLTAQRGFDVNYPIHPMQSLTAEQEQTMLRELLEAGLEL